MKKGKSTSRQNFRENFIEKAKSEYGKITMVICPAFGNEPVYFTRDGFLHLLRKGRKYRDRSDQTRRLKLLPLAVSIIKNAKIISDYKTTRIDDSTGYFWTLHGYTDRKKIRIIIRKLNKGNKHFFSIMDE